MNELLLELLIELQPENPIAFISEYFFHLAHESLNIFIFRKRLSSSKIGDRNWISNLGSAYELLCAKESGIDPAKCKRFFNSITSHWEDPMTTAFQALLEQQLGHGQRVSFKEFEFSSLLYITHETIYKQLATHSLKDKYFYEEFEKVVLDDLLASDMDKRYQMFSKKLLISAKKALAIKDKSIAAFVEALKEGLRYQGRQANEFRKIKINLGPALGTAAVQLGSTRIVSHVSSEVVRPSQASSTEGSISINTEFSPMSFPGKDKEETSEMEIQFSRMLERTIRNSRAVDTEGLCIVAGEKVWAIRVDVRVLDHDGNIFDCACLATMASLLHFKRPDVTVQGHEIIMHSSSEKSLVSLSIHHIPISTTFAFFEGGEMHVLDPSLEEEMAQIGKLTIVQNIHREICSLQLLGQVSIAPEKILLCSSIAGSKIAEMTTMLKEALVASEEKLKAL